MPINTLRDIQKKVPMKKRFDAIAQIISNIVGTPYWFFFSVTVILIWIPTGFLIGFGELWHLQINTFTTIFTFLMMSLLHASQRRWEKSMEEHLKKERSAVKEIKQETDVIFQNIPDQNSQSM